MYNSGGSSKLSSSILYLVPNVSMNAKGKQQSFFKRKL